MHGPTIRTLLALIALLASTSLTEAQRPPIRVVAEVQTPVFAGDDAIMSVQIFNAADPAIAMPEVPGLTFARGTVFRSNNNGRLSMQIRYSVQTTRAGTFIIPAITVKDGNQTASSDKLTLVVQRPKQTDEMRIELEFPKRDLFVGEPVPVTVRLLFKNNLHQRLRLSVASPTLPFDSFSLPDPRAGLNPMQQRQYQEVELLGGPAYSTLRTVVRDSTRFQEYAFTRVLIPREPGVLDLGPAIATAIERRTRVQAESAEGTLTVRPLPTEGRPATFSGLIGAYEIFATATPTEVSVGDPITLRFNITGPEPLRLVPGMDLTRQPELPKSFRVSSDLIVPQYLTGTAAFESMIRATTDTIDAIPPIELAYFDTASGEYRTARSEPIPIRVRPSNRIEIPGLEDDDEALTTNSRPGGIAPLDRSTDALDATPFSGVHALGRPGAIAAMAAPPVAYALCMGVIAVRHQRERDPAGARRRRALKRATRRLARIRTNDDQAIGAVSQAICAGVADLIDAPEAGFTADEAVDALRAREAASADDARTLLRKCDAARFGGGDAGSVETLRQEATTLMSRIASDLKEAS